MKWYDIKKYQPSYEGCYIVRWIDYNFQIRITYARFFGKLWFNYDEDSCFKGEITHFMIPEPIEFIDDSYFHCKHCNKKVCDKSYLFHCCKECGAKDDK